MGLYHLRYDWPQKLPLKFSSVLPLKDLLNQMSCEWLVVYVQLVIFARSIINFTWPIFANLHNEHEFFGLHPQIDQTNII